MKKLLALLAVLVLVSVTVGCTPKMVVSPSQGAPQTTTTSQDKRPYWPTQEWHVTIPEKQVTV